MTIYKLTTRTNGNIIDGPADDAEFTQLINTVNNVSTTTGTLRADSITSYTLASEVSIDDTWNAAGQTCTDIGIITTVDINGGTIDSTTIGGASAAAITCTTLTTGGKLTAGANEIEGSNFDITGGVISACDITVGAAKTLNVSAGTLTLADNQISGDKVEGGTIAAISITELTLANAGLHILDTNASHDLIITAGSDLTADHTITLTTGNADRTITLSGNPTLSDWFDQAVKAASSPTFVNLSITSIASNWTNAGRTVADAGILTTVDINGGSIDGVTIGAAVAGVITGTTINATTFDTNVAAAAVTLAGTTLAADGTNADIDINITPKGTGSVVLPKVDINTGAIEDVALSAVAQDAIDKAPELSLGEVRNLGLTYTANTMTICQANGAALADTATNRGYIGVPSITAGRIVTLPVVANVAWNDNGHAAPSFPVDCGMGLTKTANWAVALPLYLYAVNEDDTAANLGWFFCRVPHKTRTPAATVIHDFDAAAATDTNSSISLIGNDDAGKAVKPCVCVGSFHATWVT